MRSSQSLCNSNIPLILYLLHLQWEIPLLYIFNQWSIIQAGWVIQWSLWKIFLQKKWRDVCIYHMSRCGLHRSWVLAGIRGRDGETDYQRERVKRWVSTCMSSPRAFPVRLHTQSDGKEMWCKRNRDPSDQNTYFHVVSIFLNVVFQGDFSHHYISPWS